MELKKYIPKNSFDYYISIFNKYNFLFKIKNPRMRKMGDFKVDFRTNRLTITINNNLHPYQFHLTFLHELAHLIAYLKYKNRIKPHGVEWKKEFQFLLIENIENKIFNDEISKIVKSCYLKKDSFLSNCSKFDNYIKKLENNNRLTVADVPEKEIFTLLNNKQFKKLNERRTRCLCVEVSTKKKYLVSKNAEILETGFLLIS